MFEENRCLEEIQRAIKKGLAVSEKDDYASAIDIFSQVIQCQQTVAQTYIQRGRCHWEMRRWQEALEDFEAAGAIDPGNADIRWTTCLMYLQLNEFEKGWKYIESRWHSDKFDSPRLYTKKPRWKRYDFCEELFVWSEQGLGDQILYSSMLPALRPYVTTKITVMLDARLIPLYQRAFPDMDFIPQNARVSGIDAQIPLGSLGAEFISKLEDIPKVRMENFLIPDAAKVEETQKFLNKKEGDFILGVSWASAAPRIGDHKSISLDELRPILAMPGVRPVMLQYGDYEQQLLDYVFKYKQPFEVVPGLNLKDDIDGLAALITSCDAILTVSNATAHLAGALGKKTYLLDSNKLWFWNNRNRNSQQSLWYPSVSVYPRTNVVTPWTEQVKQIHQHMFGTGDEYYAPIG